MKYLLAIFIPPLAILLCGRPLTAFLNIFLCLLLWIPGVIHAFLIIGQHNNEKAIKKQLRAAR